MENDGIATRRSFLKSGAILAAPLGLAVPGAALAADDRAMRLARLEDEAAIRALHRDWLVRVNGRSVTADLCVSARAAACLGDEICGIIQDEDGVVEITANGERASGYYPCRIETESRMAAENTFAQMALAQGGGVTRTSEPRLLSVEYAKIADRWVIATVEAGTA
ncbi:hypothetical protein [Sphingobium nicotianae]|nr:hypothetical protein [Sphingobium nicotianae]